MLPDPVARNCGYNFKSLMETLMTAKVLKQSNHEAIFKMLSEHLE